MHAYTNKNPNNYIIGSLIDVARFSGNCVSTVYNSMHFWIPDPFDCTDQSS